MKFYGNDIANVGHRRLRPAFIDDPMLNTLLEALPDGAALLEMDGKIKLVNGKLEKLLNLNKGELVGTELAKHAATGGTIIQKAAAALQQLKRLEVSGTLPSQRFVSASLNILRTADGGAYAALLVLREPNRMVRSAEAAPDRFRFQDESGIQAGTPHVTTPALQGLLKRGSQALARGSNILVTGESGTGKTDFVRRLCTAGEQGGYPFVHVNCGMLTDAQFDMEMFGVEPGASSDPLTRGKLGYVEAADGGVLFLDEITDLSPISQMKLVAFLETGTYSRVGSVQRRQAKLKLVTATNRALRQMIADGQFREDLYYRMAVVMLELPPVRGRADFIKSLADAMLQRINLGRRQAFVLSEGFRRKLLAYDYPGNIRELSNILQHAVASAEEVAEIEHFVVPLGTGRLPVKSDADPSPADGESTSFKELIREFETYVLEKSIAENGSKRSAAKALGIDIATLIRKTNRKR
ncbi:sigma 54-interacting transcriptional regulator [Sinorhizobium sp. BG8]|uniref:sigma 54-interacting transcriptional regulator n=1 Tax=Sinorhizobium sp. BG8 TaxID=2613773 RepID=UPI00193D2937|nr:sigma 54-interacting transcriptional regulator [Sinorhizobium sp. BG8]